MVSDRLSEPAIAGDVIGVRLQAVAALARRIEQRLGAALGVNATDLSAMEHLITVGPLTSSELATRLAVTTAASTHVVDRLERAGHVSRRKHPDDRRKLIVTAADASVRRTVAQLAPLLSGLDAVVAELGAADRDVVERFLGRVVEVYTAAVEAPEPSA
jgi:DNA-binding MarR family transcriptional regulator